MTEYAPPILVLVTGAICSFLCVLAVHNDTGVTQIAMSYGHIDLKLVRDWISEFTGQAYLYDNMLDNVRRIPCTAHGLFRHGTNADSEQ